MNDVPNKPAELMTPEERQALAPAFLKIVEHAADQYEKATTRNSACMYRYNGNKCFIGALIPDEMYEAGIEGENVMDRSVRDLLAKALGVERVSDQLASTLRRIQLIHDRYNPNQWFEYLMREHAVLTEVLLIRIPSCKVSQAWEEGERRRLQRMPNLGNG